jgi:hypothetical protein
MKQWLVQTEEQNGNNRYLISKNMKQWLVQTGEQNGNNRYLISRKYETVVGTNRRTKWKQPLSNLKKI